MIKLTPTATPLQFEHSDQVANWQKTFLAHGGFDVETGNFVRFKDLEHLMADGELSAAEYVLDSIAGATEFGSIVLGEYADFEALFANPKSIPAFLEALAGYGEDFWLNERHFKAFFNQLIFDEMECNTHQAIAAWLEEQAV